MVRSAAVLVLLGSLSVSPTPDERSAAGPVSPYVPVQGSAGGPTAMVIARPATPQDIVGVWEKVVVPPEAGGNAGLPRQTHQWIAILEDGKVGWMESSNKIDMSVEDFLLTMRILRMNTYEHSDGYVVVSFPEIRAYKEYWKFRVVMNDVKTSVHDYKTGDLVWTMFAPDAAGNMQPRIERVLRRVPN